MSRPQPALLFCVAAFLVGGFSLPSARAQEGTLVGKLEGRTYVSPTGLFKVTSPVLPELGGVIRDTPYTVIFQDNYTTHVTIAASPQNALQRWQLSTRGLKEYLGYYFMTEVMPFFRGGKADENAKFIPGTMEGALLTYVNIPGGSVFADKAPQSGPNDAPPVAKRGNLVFVRAGHVFVISIELAERVTEGKAYNKTPTEEDDLLRKRLLDVVEKITFSPLPATASDAAKK